MSDVSDAMARAGNARTTSWPVSREWVDRRVLAAEVGRLQDIDDEIKDLRAESMAAQLEIARLTALANVLLDNRWRLEAMAENYRPRSTPEGRMSY